jgi:hypothetical protein
MAKFRDKATGNVFEFTQEHDIKTMREHTEYVEVIEEVLKKPLTTKKQLKETVNGDL